MPSGDMLTNEPLPDTDERIVETGCGERLTLRKIRDELDAIETSGAHPDKRPNRVRTSGPDKGRKSDVAHLMTIAIQALQTAREAVLKVRADMPKHERDRLLIPVVSDAGLAMRSFGEAVERLEAGKL